MLMKKSVMLLLFAALTFVGCEGNERLEEKARIEGAEGAKAELNAQLQEKDKLIEKARAEGKAQAEAELTAQNANLVQKATEMEEDLAVRHRFYQAAQGTYEGVLGTEQGKFRIKITLVPSLPPYIVNRTRQLDEISSDLNSLYFNAQVVQWNTANKLSAVGCRIEHVRPDIVNGTIAIASENCPNLYSLNIADEETTANEPSGMALRLEPQASVALASSIRSGRINRVSSLRGQVHPTTNATVYEFSATKSGN